MTTWLNVPIVLAPSADDRSKTVQYGVSKVFVERNTFINRRTPILQLWCHLAGKPPPINNISRVFEHGLPPTLTTLHDSVACFQGVKRPHNDEKDGNSILVYVLNPSVTIVYDPDLACVAKAMRVPKNTVLTVHVCVSDPLLAEHSSLNGIVTRLEYVSSGADEPTLPFRHQTRYIHERWRTQ